MPFLSGHCQGMKVGSHSSNRPLAPAIDVQCEYSVRERSIGSASFEKRGHVSLDSGFLLEELRGALLVCSEPDTGTCFRRTGTQAILNIVSQLCLLETRPGLRTWQSASFLPLEDDAERILLGP